MSIATPESISAASLCERLQDRQLLLTVNNRLADAWRQHYDQWMLTQGKSVWETPRIQPLGRWMQDSYSRLLQSGHEYRLLLEAIQEKLLWSEIIAEDEAAQLIMQPESIARQVMQAWQLTRQWQIPMGAIKNFGLAESAAMADWSRQFEARCDAQGWLSASSLPDVICSALQQSKLAAPPNLLFSGFQDPNRQHEQLWQSLAETGCTLNHIQNPPRNRHLQQKQCIDFSDEIRSAANWARDLLLQGKSHIAVVIPALNEQRENVVQVFEEVLHPERQGGLPPYQKRDLFGLSLGLPLDAFPLVSDAFALLDLLQPRFSLRSLERTLQSVYLSADKSFAGIEHASLLLQLKRHGRTSWTLRSLVNYLQRNQQGHGKAALEKLTALLESVAKLPSKQAARDWSELFANCWTAMGWPGARTLNSNEYQQSQRLLKLLNEFRRLSAVKSQMSISMATRLLRQMARETVFQSQSQQAPVQVFGMLEAAGQQFDYLWLTGLDDRVLPPSTSPNPFIPLALQRQYKLPHCSSERDLDYARGLLSGFINDSETTVLSFAARDGDIELRPSPLLSMLAEMGFDCESESSTVDSGYTAQQPLTMFTLETYIDQQLPALPENQPVSGGSGVITAQAGCPFMAAARYRLNAEKPETEVDGVSPMLRGTQVHDILYRLWQKLQNLSSLKQLDDAELQSLINEQVKDILNKAAIDRPDLYQPRFLELETTSLNRLLFSWFDLEKQRQDNFSVVSMEETASISVGGLLLKTKADRIDQLDNGERIIIDYKTGASASSRSWSSETVSEPQLPLYSLVENEQLTALTLARVHEQNAGFDGISRKEKLLQGVNIVKPSEILTTYLADKDSENVDELWRALRQHWQTQLNLTGESFRRGDARINPSNCQYCPYPSLCRKHELPEVFSADDFNGETA